MRMLKEEPGGRVGLSDAAPSEPLKPEIFLVDLVSKEAKTMRTISK